MTVNLISRIAIGLLALLGAASIPVSASTDGIFGSASSRFDDLSRFSKWNDMWQRHQPAADALRSEGDSSSPAFCLDRPESCGRQGWQALVDSQSIADPMLALQAVNRHINTTRYVLDPVNWGVPDYWATPVEFLLKDGDCEDYAISKYITLKHLGFNPASMRLAIVQDLNLRAAHAV